MQEHVAGIEPAGYLARRKEARDIVLPADGVAADQRIGVALLGQQVDGLMDRRAETELNVLAHDPHEELPLVAQG